MRPQPHGCDAPGPRPGFILTCGGSDIGVVEHVHAGDGAQAPVLHVRGGISGSLRYAIPANAVGEVEPEARRFTLRDGVRFEPEAITANGEVLLGISASSRALLDEWRDDRRLPRACTTFRVYAADGFVGVVEAALCHAGDEVDYLVVRVHRHFRTRYPVIPATRVVHCEPLAGIVHVAGTRRDLMRLSERLPLAS